MGSAATSTTLGAEQATTTQKRGRRGNGRRIRRQLDRELALRQAILVEDEAAPQAIVDLRARLERVDRRIFQLNWEERIAWTGEPGHGPAFDQNPEAARAYERWRGILDGHQIRAAVPGKRDRRRKPVEPIEERLRGSLGAAR